MTSALPTKRKRGGQPGNQNARNNRGNRTVNRHRFARGNQLGGARPGNRNACKEPQAPHLVLLEDYQDCPLAIAWIRANADALDKASFTADHQRDRALFAAHRGLTVEAIVRDRKEYECGLYSLIGSDNGRQAWRTA